MSNRVSFDFSDIGDTLCKSIDPIKEMQVLKEHNAVTFLLPEVIELEINKSHQAITEDLENNYGKVIEAIDNGCSSIWNEINAKELKSMLYQVIDKEKSKKMEHWNKMYDAIKDFFRSDIIDFLELTPQIMCAAEKRKIEGMITDTQMNDAYVIESIYDHCKKNDCKNVFFVTNYKKDFFEKRVDNYYNLKSKFLDPNIKVYGLYDIKQLPKCLNTVLDVVIPCDSPVFDISEEFERRFPDWDFCDHDNNEGWEEYSKMVVANDKALVQSFENGAETLPEYTRELRKKLLLDIQELFIQCRSKKSWDNRSELKLYQWLEDRTESEIPLSKLSDLFLIKDSMQEYLQIHIDMDKAYEDDEVNS